MAREKINAVVIIFDTGQSVGQKYFEDGSTFFHKARNCISWILRRKMLSMSEDLICLLLTGTDEQNAEGTVDTLNSSFCENVNMKFDFQLCSWDMLDYIDNKVKLSYKVSDWLGALAVSIEKLKFLEESYNVLSKTVVILSDLNYTRTDVIDYCLMNIKNMNVEITMIGLDYISPLSEIDEDDQPSPKKRCMETEISHLRGEKNISGEKLLHILWDRLGDLIRISNFDSAFRQLSSYSKKIVRPSPWNCTMDIGDLKINVQMFKKVDRKTPFRPRIKCVKPADSANPEGSSQFVLTDIVRDKIMYYKHFEQDATETKEISVGKDDIIPGFRYGTSIIPFSDEDNSILGYKPGKKCFSILGFTPIDNIPHYILTGEGSYIVVPRDKDKKAEVALSAIVRAMSETGNVGVVRRVYSDDRGLSLGVLYPVVEEPESSELHHKECLVFIELAFEEDVRTVRLPRIRRIQKKITPKQYEIIDDLINEMDLMKVRSGIKGETYEALDLFSRHEIKSQFFQHCIVHKALYPTKPLPTKLPIHCLKYLTQSDSLNAKSRILGEKLSELFTTKSESGTKTEKENSNLDSANLYRFDSAEEKTAMTCFERLFSVNKYPPVEAISNLLDLCVRELHFKSEDIIRAFLHFIRATRQSALHDYTDDYNYWMRRLRINLGIKGELVGSIWKRVLEDNLGLITVEEHKDSYTSKEDAAFFIDSLECKIGETEEEKRKMNEEVEEAINLLF